MEAENMEGGRTRGGKDRRVCEKATKKTLQSLINNIEQTHCTSTCYMPELLEVYMVGDGISARKNWLHASIVIASAMIGTKF